VSLDESEELITVKSGAVYYPPISVPTGIFSDTFNGAGPHNGRWIPFLTYDKGTYPIRYPQSGWTCQNVGGVLEMGIIGDVGNGALASVNLLTRAEFRTPFKVSFDVLIPDITDQYNDSFIFYFTSPNPQDGYLIDVAPADSHLYGKIVGGVKAVKGALEWVDLFDSTSFGSWVVGTNYNVSIDMVNNDEGLLDITTTITEIGAGVVGTHTVIDVLHSRSGTCRCCFSAQTLDNNTNPTFFIVDNFKVSLEPSNKTRAIVTVLGSVVEASDDVISITVIDRKGSYPSAEVTLRNDKHQYDDLAIEGEIEIRAGYSHMMWLLFRGNIDLPILSYPPTQAVLSAKGFGKRLDHRETDGESWVTTDAGDIVDDLIVTYYSGVFTTDFVHGGAASVSLDSDNQSVSTPIRTLAEMSGYISYVDWNKHLHFMLPTDDETDSSLTINKADDILRVSKRNIDEIINSVTVIGFGGLTKTEVDGASSYWLRERTFIDDTLTSQASVDAKALEYLAIYKDPVLEIPVELVEWYILSLNNTVNIVCDGVDLDQEILTDSITYNYSVTGITTTINGLYRGVTMADILIDIDRRVA
jgi:hypothetical protein